MPIKHARGLCARLKNKTKLVRKRSAHRLRIRVKYAFRRTRKEPVFILTTRRTGSNLLLAHLNSVPGLSFAPEVLNEKMKYGLPGKGVSRRAVLAHIRHSINDCPAVTCGTKLLAFQMAKHALDAGDLLRAFPNARFIVLYRRSLAEQFVSLKIAEATDQWLWSEDFRLPESITIKREELEAFRNRTLRFYGELRNDLRLADRTLFISYEELVSDAQGLFDGKIFPFLGIPSSGVAASLKKQNTIPLRSLIENYGEIEPILGNMRADFRDVRRSDVRRSSAVG